MCNFCIINIIKWNCKNNNHPASNNTFPGNQPTNGKLYISPLTNSYLTNNAADVFCCTESYNQRIWAWFSLSIFAHSSSWWPVRPSEGDQEMQTLDHDWLWNQLPCGSGSEFLNFYPEHNGGHFIVFIEENDDKIRLFFVYLLYGYPFSLQGNETLCFCFKTLSIHTIFFQKLIVHTETL